MAAGKPIVTMINGISNAIVEEAECGLTANAGDYKGLAKNVKALYGKTSAERVQMGNKASLYYESHFNKETVVNSIIELIENA